MLRLFAIDDHGSALLRGLLLYLRYPGCTDFCVQEEDFATHTYNRELLHRFDIDAIHRMMKQASENIESHASHEIKGALRQRFVLRDILHDMLDSLFLMPSVSSCREG